MTVTVAIPTIPQRSGKLRQAITSVTRQIHPVDGIAIAMDLTKSGSAVTRNRALAMVSTEWTAFLDDDDQFLDVHVQRLMNLLEETGADIAYSLPRVLDPQGNERPREWDWGGGPEFDPDLLRRKAHIQTTCIVRTELAKDVGGFKFVRDETGASNDDHGFFLSLLDSGAKFAHLHEPTFIWNHHGGNTSGRSDRGDALR